MIVVKHVDSIFGSLLPIRLSTSKLVIDNYRLNIPIAVSSGGPNVMDWPHFIFMSLPGRNN